MAVDERELAVNKGFEKDVNHQNHLFNKVFAVLALRS